MTLRKVDGIRIIAVDTVLEGLGSPLFNIISYYLERDHDIVIRPNANAQSSSLPEIHRAIGRIAGENAADLILEEVLIEMDRVSDWDYCHQTKG